MHWTQFSASDTTIWHKVSCLPFKITLQELTGHYMCHLPNNCYCNCYHFNQEVSTNRPRPWKRLQREEEEEEGGGGRVRGGAGRGAHGQRRTTFRWNQSDLSWWCHQPWADPDRLTERASSQGHILFLQFYFSVYGSVSTFLFTPM